MSAIQGSVTAATKIENSSLAEGALEHGAIQKPDELKQLIDLIQSRKAPKCVLEIGTMAGGTLWLWCQLAYPTAHIVSVDLPGGDWGGGYTDEAIPKLLTYTKQQQTMHLFRCDSHEDRTLASVVRYLKLKKAKVDLLFIDGDHTYDGVRRDFEMYGPLVKEDGLIVFHDIVDHTGIPDCQVKPFWDEIKENHRYEEFISPEHGAAWGGIGVLIGGEK